MLAPVHGRADEARGFFSQIAMAAGFLGLLIASYVTAWTGNGSLLVAGIIGIFGIALVIRRPAVGVFILMTTFLFTYPAFLRGIGNLTINNVLGMLLVPLMFYEMIRDRSWWVLRFRPFLLMAVAIGALVVSARFYGGASEYVETIGQEKVEASQRAQGPAYVQTRDAGAKLLTRFAFLVFFVFFVRTNRDMQSVAAIVIAALLFTYFSVSTGAGEFGWGTGRLRALSDAGGAVYAGRNPNKLAFFALFGLSLLWYGRQTIKRPILYPLWAAVTALTFIMIPLTGSRSGMLNLLIFMLVVLLEGRFSYRKVLGLFAITFVIVVQFAYQTSVLDLLLPTKTAQRLSNIGVHTDVVEEEGLEAQGSAGGRYRTAEAALRVWSGHPVFGVGIGNFESERAATDPFAIIGPPHNSYLWALTEGGLVTLVLYLWLFGWTIRHLHEIRWEYEARFGPMKLGWLVGAMRTVLIVFMFFSFFADMWYHDFFWIIMGMSLTLIRLHDSYIETGQVPQRFLIGGSSPVLVGAPVPATRKPLVVAPPDFLHP